MTGDVEAALARHRQDLHLIDQYTAAGDPTTYNQVAIACKVGTAATMKEIVDEHQDVFGVSVVEEIARLQKAVRLELKVINEAWWDVYHVEGQVASGLTVVRNGEALLSALIVQVAPALVVLLLTIGLAATLLSRRLASHDARVIGPVGQMVAGLAALSMTVVLFALSPTEIISRDVQAWAFTIVLALIPLIAVLAFVWRSLRRRAFRFSLRAMLIGMLIVCLASAVVSAWVKVGLLWMIPFDFSIPSRDWDGLDVASLRTAVANNEAWVVLYQWLAYHGPYLTVAFWAVTVIVLHAFPGRIVWRHFARSLPSLRQRLAGAFRCLARPALAMAVLVLMTYVILAPRVLELVEQDFQRSMELARQAEQHWSNVKKAIPKVRSDQELMDELVEAVEAELSREERDSP